MSSTWSHKSVYRTTKCFSPQTNGYPGGFPVGFLKWVKEQGWWGTSRVYLCAGRVEDPQSIRVDLRPETNPTHLQDARQTTLPAESANWVMIDPPYTVALAERLYNTQKHWGSINQFTKEGRRLLRVGGLLLTLSYEVPKRVADCDLVACVGVYQTISVAHMRCFTVWQRLS